MLIVNKDHKTNPLLGKPGSYHDDDGDGFDLIWIANEYVVNVIYM